MANLRTADRRSRLVLHGTNLRCEFTRPHLASALLLLLTQRADYYDGGKPCQTDLVLS